MIIHVVCPKAPIIATAIQLSGLLSTEYICLKKWLFASKEHIKQSQQFHLKKINLEKKYRKGKMEIKKVYPKVLKVSWNKNVQITGSSFKFKKTTRTKMN